MTKWLILLQIAVAAAQSFPEKGPCAVPVPDTSFNINWFKEQVPKDGFYISLANDMATLYIAELLQNQLMTLGEDFTTMCGKLTIQPSEDFLSATGAKYGYGDKIANFNCSLSNRILGAYTCDYLKSTLGKYNEEDVYITLGDNQQFALFVVCMASGEQGWFVTSTVKTLSEEKKTAILNHVQSIGFDPKNVLSIHDKCP